MKKIYIVKGIDIGEEGSLITPQIPGQIVKVERIAEKGEEDLFSTPDENSRLFQYIYQEGLKLMRPLTRGIGLVNFIVMLILNSVLSFFFKINEPLIRGWRLNIIRRVALNEPVQVPSWRPDHLIVYFLKGWVLIISRTIYFLPAMIIVYLSGFQLFDVLKELFFFIRDKFLNADNMGYVEFLLQKILPQFGIEVLIHLVVLLLYVVFVWPIYRIITIKYALKKCSGAGFFSVKQIYSAIQIFRKNAAPIYGVYAFVLSIDVITILVINGLTAATLGAFSLVAPAVSLLMRFWIKGYAYGILGRTLIQKSAL